MAERETYEPIHGPAPLRKRAARGKITPRLREWVLRRDGGRCLRCSTDTNLTIDHIWPAAAGGMEMASNLQVLCMRCNNKKQAEWEREHGWHSYPISRGVLLSSYLLTPRELRTEGFSCGI